MRRTCLVALALAWSAAATAADTAAPVVGDHAHHATARVDAARYPPQFQRFVDEMDRDMQKMMTDMHRPGYSGNADVDFLAMMIAHHQGAVDMARLVLIHGKDPLTRQLAEEIIASQTTEISAMRARLDVLRRATAGGAPEFPALAGTRGLRE